MRTVTRFLKLLTVCLSVPMEQSSSWNANYLLASQGIPHICWNPKVHHRVHKSLPPFTILSQINPFHASSNYLLKIHLILFSNLFLGLPSDHFPSRFPTKPLQASLLSSIRAICPAHLILLYVITETVYCEKQNYEVPHYVIVSILLVPNFFYIIFSASIYFRILTF